MKSQQSGHNPENQPDRPDRGFGFELGFGLALAFGLTLGLASFFEFELAAALAGLEAVFAAAFATSRASGRAFGRELRGPRFEPGVSTLCSVL